MAVWLLTAAAIMLSFSNLAVPANAAPMTASEEIINKIKDYEGFRSNVYWDQGSAFIGYGTICKSTDYPNGITREKADALLREAVQVKEASINKILTKYNVQLTQQEYDAVLDLTYNIGTAWMSTSSRLYTYLTTGHHDFTDIEIVNAFGTWCHVGENVSNLLVERRIWEAKVFLYGDYAGADPHTYKYLTYDAGSGDAEHSIMFYETGKTYGPLQQAVRSGYTLEGWYTPDGEKISPYAVVSKNHAVTARWVRGNVPVNTGVYTDVASTAWYYSYVGLLSSQGIFSGYPDGTFKPDKTVSCGEALKLILVTVGFDEQPAADGHWAGGYLRLAVSKGLVTQSDMPDLNANITRRQVVELAAKSIGLPPLEPENVFADTDDGFVLQFYHCGIVGGDSTSGQLKFYPDNSITRAEFSAILARIVNSGIIPYD